MKLDIGIDIAGEYVVERELGEGEMAMVYLVSHLATGTPWALKVVKTGYANLKDRLQQEATVHKQLSHSNIAAMLDIIEGDGFIGLIMEYVEGETLDIWLRSNRPSREESIQIFGELLDAMNYAHEKNIIHRDLKPSNIIMQKQGERWTPKVLDFGIAKAVQDDGNNLTQTGTAMGTPGYMAPEQIRDAKNVNQKADIFALGAIFYELLAGAPPFQGKNNFELINAVVTQPHRPIDFILHDISDNIIQLIDKSLEKDPNQRISSCKEMLNLLKATPEKQEPSAPEVFVEETKRTSSFQDISPADEAPPSNTPQEPPEKKSWFKKLFGL